MDPQSKERFVFLYDSGSAHQETLKDLAEIPKVKAIMEFAWYSLLFLNNLEI